MNDTIAGVVLLVMIVGGLGLLAYAIRGRQRIRELIMKERIALIEKGVAPPPEVDPARFERVITPPRTINVGVVVTGRGDVSSARYRSAGIMIIGLGVALFILIAFVADASGVGFGIGGAFAALGVSLFINGMMPSHGTVPPDTQPAQPPPSAPDSSSNVAP
jgi:hypothetical protein